MTTETMHAREGLIGQAIAATGRRLLPRDLTGGMTLTLPSGRQHRIGFQKPGIHCDLVLRNYRPVFSAMRRGAVGFGESVMAGDVESSDITSVLRFYLKNREALNRAARSVFFKSLGDRLFHLERNEAGESALVAEFHAAGGRPGSIDAPPGEQAIPLDARPPADAMVTDRPGLLLGILTADCAPVLLADAQAGIVGAAHAGWKGAIGGVTDKTIDAMVALGAARDRIAAAIGPCIARASYEVGAGFARRFFDHDPENERFFSAGRPDHFQFDLEGYVTHRLAVAGVSRVEAMGIDTYGDAESFYSFRRATHRGEPGYGRQISLIGLRG